MVDGIPRGGMCSYCTHHEHDCIEEDSPGECDNFERTESLEIKIYSGKAEPIMNSHGLEFIEPSNDGTGFNIRRFGEFECIRCETINFVQQERGKLIKPYECENEQCGRKSCFKQLFSTEIMNPPWKVPTGIIETEPQLMFDIIVDYLKSCIHLQDQTQYKIFALWIMASWVVENFDTCAYLMFIAPKDSGKTRGLEIITEIGYRSIPSVSFSASSLFRSMDMWHGTLLVDEAEYQLNQKTEKGQDLYGILNGGYKKGMYAIRTETVGESLIPTPFDIFGFKAIAATRPFNPTLESRSIIFNMEQHEIKHILIPKELSEEIRNRLLFFRYSNLGKIKPILPTHLKKGRIVEIFHPIYSIANIVDPDMISELDTYIMNVHNRNVSEDKVSMPEVDIIRAMNELWDKENNDSMKVYGSDILERVKPDFPDLTGQGIGHLIKAMGFLREKDRRGMFISIENDTNKEKFDQYKERFGL